MELPLVFWIYFIGLIFSDGWLAGKYPCERRGEMRISIFKEDKGFVANPEEWVVTLDGQIVRGCCEADTEKGYVAIYALDDRGQRILSKGYGGEDEWKIKYLFGEVVIVHVEKPTWQ